MDTNTKYFNTLYPLEIINMINNFVGYCDCCNGLNKECNYCEKCTKSFCCKNFKICLVCEKNHCSNCSSSIMGICISCFKGILDELNVRLNSGNHECDDFEH